MRVNMSAIGSVVIIPVKSPCPYQLALITPGTSPASASFLKQILHNLNLRKNPRGRPQRKQRLRCRQANFGFFPAAIDAAVAAAIFSSLAIFAVVAINSFSYCARNGIPRCFNNASPSASVLALVVMQIFIPLVFSTLL
jgi:hypothetical protein